jgi:predicted transcriptional regulator
MQLETPFTPLQLELLKVCNAKVTDIQLIEIKNMIGAYFLNNAIESATEVSKEKGYTESDYRNWVIGI